MATYKEGSARVGKKGLIEIDELTFEVEILDFKQAYGKDRWLVRPVAGHGERWVEEVTVEAPKKRK